MIAVHTVCFCLLHLKQNSDLFTFATALTLTVTHRVLVCVKEEEDIC